MPPTNPPDARPDPVAAAPQADGPPVTLANCADEPIHIPGAIQPHGALVAFDLSGHVTWFSANAPTLLACPTLTIGASLAEMPDGLYPGACALIQEALDACGADEQFTQAHELEAPQHRADLVLNISREGVIAEFEPRAQSHQDVSRFALQAHRCLDRLKRTADIDALLQRAVREIRAITGFDRVMAYRFRHDDSGDIVAESHVSGLESLLGRRYPATDIPAQARRLYVLNTLRLIGDVTADAVPLLGRPGVPPLDLSHAVLRSVSPIHIEYLRNMGVGASMSVSIVIDGRLWGMFACHHMQRLVVPHALRMAVDVLAQVVAATIATLTAKAHAQRSRDALTVQAACVQALSESEDVADALAAHLPHMALLLGADAAVITSGGKVAQHGLDSATVAAELATLVMQATQAMPAVQAASSANRGPLAWHRLDDWQGMRPAALDGYCGLLAHPFDEQANGWLIFLRKEQIETVRWGGKPDKVITTGPNGPRLTPRGSFDEWRETVRGQAVPWSASDLDIADQWATDLQRTALAHHMDIERARAHLMAVLGHDLRDPLHSIKMAAHVLELSGPQTGASIGQRIQKTAGRMQRLVGLVLDMTKIRSGLGLGLSFAPVDLIALTQQILDERDMAQLDARYELTLPAEARLDADADRLAQVISNLLSNARHHGDVGHPIRIAISADDRTVSLTVRNTAQPIPADVMPVLFDPFKRSSLGNARNVGGLGLGLYIADQITREHRGSLTYRYEAPEVVFEVRLPLTAA